MSGYINEGGGPAQSGTGSKTGVHSAALSHPEDSCQRCRNRNPATWHAPSPLWNAVMRDPVTGADDFGIVCPTCFVELAAAKGFRTNWHFGPHGDVSHLWRDHDGRTWDAERCLWVPA